MLRLLAAIAGVLAVSGCGSLPPPVGGTAVAWVVGPVDRATLPGALAAARARYPDRKVTERDLVRISCSLDDFSWYEGNAVAPVGQPLDQGMVVRVKVGTPLMGITDRHLDEVIGVISTAGQTPARLPRARNGKLIEYPPDVKENYVGSSGSTLALACSAKL